MELDRILQLNSDHDSTASPSTNSTMINNDDHTSDSQQDDDNNNMALISRIVSNILLFLLIFGLSATVQTKHFQQHISNTKPIVAGLTCQFVIMPFLGFLSVIIFSQWGFTEAMGISLLVVTASPGGSYSNWFCSLFNADLALSVAVTTVSSIISIGLLPANLSLYGWLAYGVVLDTDAHVNIVKSLDFGALFITLAVVLAAILLGLYVGYKWDDPIFHKRANRLGTICGLSLIIFAGFIGSGGGGSSTSVWSMEWSFYVATAVPCIIGICIANFVARIIRMSGPESVAIAIETCYQNTAIATSVAITMYTDPDMRSTAVAVPFFYGFVEAIGILIFCIVSWKMGWTLAPPNERLWTIITTTYEVQEHSTADERSNENDEENPKSVVFSTSIVDNLPLPPSKQFGMKDRPVKSEETMETEDTDDDQSSTASDSIPASNPIGLPIDESNEIEHSVC